MISYNLLIKEYFNQLFYSNLLIFSKYKENGCSKQQNKKIKT